MLRFQHLLFNLKFADTVLGKLEIRGHSEVTSFSQGGGSHFVTISKKVYFVGEPCPYKLSKKRISMLHLFSTFPENLEFLWSSTFLRWVVFTYKTEVDDNENGLDHRIKTSRPK